MSSTILSEIARDYESINGAWFTGLFAIAQAVFWTLVLIELTWSALDREGGPGVISALLRKGLAVGFCYALLLNSGTWIRAAIEGFRRAGATGSGVLDLSPTGVFDQGLAGSAKLRHAPNQPGLLESISPNLVAALTAVAPSSPPRSLPPSSW